MTAERAGTAATALAVVGLVWLGALLGVSFLATPVKFLAPSLSLPVALDVGRQTFLWFGRVEIVLALTLLASALAFEWPCVRRALGGSRREADAADSARAPLPQKTTNARAARPEATDAAAGAAPGRWPLATLAAVLLLAAVALQVLWLLPLLDARVEIILRGGTPPSSRLHDVYVWIEGLKLAALAGVGWLALAALRSRAAT